MGYSVFRNASLYIVLRILRFNEKVLTRIDIISKRCTPSAKLFAAEWCVETASMPPLSMLKNVGMGRAAYFVPTLR